MSSAGTSNTELIQAKKHYTTTENRKKMMERAPRGVLPAWWHGHQIPKCTHIKAVGHSGRRSREEPTKCLIYLHLMCHRQFAFHFQFGVIFQDITIWWFTSIRAVPQFLVLNFGKWPIYWKNPILNEHVQPEWAHVCFSVLSSDSSFTSSVREPNIDSFVLETNGYLESQQLGLQ